MTNAIIIDASRETSVVFGGIAWKPLIGSNLAGQSEKFAVASKATHFVAAGEHSAAVGIIKLPADKTEDKGRNFYSAAAVFAQAHQSGVLITTQTMLDGRVWVVAAHDGVVIRDTDILLSDADAQELIVDIQRRHANAVVIKGEFETLQYLNTKSQLVAVRNTFQKIPKPVKVFAVFVLALMVLDTSWSQYKKYKVRQARALETSQYVDAHAEWTSALNQWAMTVKPDGRMGLIRLYAELGETPPKIGGWNQSEASCSRAPNGWSCSARYEAGVNATNLSFIQNMPKGWTATWDGLTGAIGSWAVQVDRSNIDRAKIQKISDFSLNYISALQQVLPAFKKVTLVSPSTVQIPAPQVYINRGQGEELVTVPYPEGNTAGIELPSVQTFEMEGPLRTLAVLPLINETVIKQLRFVVGSQGSVPTLRDSIYTAKLIGEIYVR
jgi:hypothetical protein